MKNMTGAIYVAGPLDYESRRRVGRNIISSQCCLVGGEVDPMMMMDPPLQTLQMVCGGYFGISVCWVCSSPLKSDLESCLRRPSYQAIRPDGLSVSPAA